MADPADTGSPPKLGIFGDDASSGGAPNDMGLAARWALLRTENGNIGIKPADAAESAASAGMADDAADAMDVVSGDGSAAGSNDDEQTMTLLAAAPGVGTASTTEPSLQSFTPAYIATGAVAPDVISQTGSNIVFHNTYSSGVTAAYHQAVIDAEHFFEGHLTAGSTVDLYASFGFASLGASFSAENNFSTQPVSYATWRAQVAARATSADDAAAVAALPTSDPTGGRGVALPLGYARMLGLSVGNTPDSVVLNSDLNFNFTNGDATGALEHELSEGAMGRIGSLGFHGAAWNPMDFYRFAANGTRDFTGGRDGVATYFGFDATHVFTGFQYHNSVNANGQYDGFDLADWDHTVGDAFGPGGPSSPGVVSETDLRVMDVLGWGRTGSGGGDDFPANATTTGAVAVGGSATGNLEIAGDHDWFRVQLTAGVQYSIEEDGSSIGAGTLLDPFMALYDGASRFITSNDDGAGNMNSRIIYTPTASGAYYIDAGAFNNQYTGTYRVSVATVGPTLSFSAPQSILAAYTPSNGGWDSQDQNPRELADINGDGRADIVGFGADGIYVSLANSGGGFGSPVSGLRSFGTSSAAGSWTSQDQNPRELADVNGDGRADIVGFGADGVYVSLANRDGTFASPAFALRSFGTSGAAGFWTSYNQDPRELADVNGDGRADILGFGADGVYVSLANSDGTFESPVLTVRSFGTGNAAGSWTNQNLDPREVADVNGDGRADIIGFGADGVYVSLANSNGTFASPVFTLRSFGTSSGAGSWIGQDINPRELADVNGDGLADIVGFGQDQVYVSLATGGGNFAAPVSVLHSFGQGTGGWSNNDVYPRFLGDVNGDGLADIVGFGQEDVYVSQAIPSAAPTASTSLSTFGFADMSTATPSVSATAGDGSRLLGSIASDAAGSLGPDANHVATSVPMPLDHQLS